MQAVTVSFNLRRDMYEQIRNLAFHARLSQSSIVEIALRKFLDGRTEQEISQELLSCGARLRRVEHLYIAHNGSD